MKQTLTPAQKKAALAYFFDFFAQVAAMRHARIEEFWAQKEGQQSKAWEAAFSKLQTLETRVNQYLVQISNEMQEVGIEPFPALKGPGVAPRAVQASLFDVPAAPKPTKPQDHEEEDDYDIH